MEDDSGDEFIASKPAPLKPAPKRPAAKVLAPSGVDAAVIVLEKLSLSSAAAKGIPKPTEVKDKVAELVAEAKPVAPTKAPTKKIPKKKAPPNKKPRRLQKSMIRLMRRTVMISWAMAVIQRLRWWYLLQLVRESEGRQQKR